MSDFLSEFHSLARAVARRPPEAAVPRDLVFDDEPLEQILYQEELPRPTSANLFGPILLSYMERILEANQNRQEQDVQSLTWLLVCEGIPLPPETYQSLVPVLLRLADDALQVPPDQCPGDVGVLLQHLWQLAEEKADDQLQLTAGVALAYWYESQQSAEDSRRVWDALTDLQRRQGDVDHKVIPVVTAQALRFWQEGHWQREAERFARTAQILQSLSGEEMDLAESVGETSTPVEIGGEEGLLTLAAPALRVLVEALNSRPIVQPRNDLYRRAVALGMTEKLAGMEHPYTLTCLNILLRFFQDEGNHTDALLLCRRTVELRERILGPDHPLVGQSLNNLGLTLVSLGQWDEAESVLLRSAAINRQTSNPHYWLGRLYRQRDAAGDQEKEARAWRRYLELGPTNAERREEAVTRLKELVG